MGKKNAAIRAAVSERALIARINRALAKENDDRVLRKCREDSRSFRDLGHYYVVDISRNSIIDHHIEIEEMGRQWRVLKSWEELAAD